MGGEVDQGAGAGAGAAVSGGVHGGPRWVYNLGLKFGLQVDVITARSPGISSLPRLLTWSPHLGRRVKGRGEKLAGANSHFGRHSFDANARSVTGLTRCNGCQSRVPLKFNSQANN